MFSVCTVPNIRKTLFSLKLIMVWTCYCSSEVPRISWELAMIRKYNGECEYSCSSTRSSKAPYRLMETNSIASGCVCRYPSVLCRGPLSPEVPKDRYMQMKAPIGWPPREPQPPKVLAVQRQNAPLLFPLTKAHQFCFQDNTTESSSDSQSSLFNFGLPF